MTHKCKCVEGWDSGASCGYCHENLHSVNAEAHKEALYYRDRYKMLMESASALAEQRMYRIMELEAELARKE